MKVRALKMIARTLMIAGSLAIASGAHAETLRLSTLDKPGSDGANAAQADHGQASANQLCSFDFHGEVLSNYASRFNGGR